MLRLFPQIDIQPPKYRLPCAISGHTIFEASAQNQTPTSLYASAKKTRMRKFVPMFLASFCPLLASGVALLTTHFWIQVEFLNIIFSKNNSEQVGVVFDRIMGSSDPELIVDQVGNLSTSKETVLFLELLFLQTDSPFELGIMDDLVQGWSNPRIKYFKIRHWNTTNRWRRF